MAVTSNGKILANKVEEKVAAQREKKAPLSSLVSAPIKSNFPVQKMAMAKAAFVGCLAIESVAKIHSQKRSSTSKKIDDLQTQLNTLHEVVHASNRERENIKVSIADMESKLVGEMTNLAALIKANVAKHVKHENKTGPKASPSDISVNSKAGSSHARPHLPKSYAARSKL